MSDASNFLTSSIALGVIATALLDLFSLARQRLFKTPAPDYAPVGRWVAHLARGRFFHSTIAATPKLAGEAAIGWAAHYAVGIVFAGLLLAVFGMGWLRAPSLTPALIIGIGSVAAPFFILQPGMGFGIAASRTPNPRAARLRSLSYHAAFAMALYAAGWIVRALL